MLAKISTAAVVLSLSALSLAADASPMRRSRTTSPVAIPAVTVVNQVAAPINVNIQNNIAVGVGAPATATGGNLTNNNGIGQTATAPATASSGFSYTNQSVVPTNINVQNNIVYGVAGGMGKVTGGSLRNNAGIEQGRR
jgi:hypothetical protein